MRGAGKARDRGVPVSRANERNEGGADAATRECARIYESERQCPVSQIALSTESVDAPRQRGAKVKAYWESTANWCNEAGADAAALECNGICETGH